jgi:hypothetical protein
MQRPDLFNRLFSMFTSMGSDDKRKSAWREYGYKDNLVFEDFYNLYEREGVAHGVVDLLNGKCFETSPWVIEGDEFDEKRPETPWEKEFRQFAKKAKLWKAFKTADKYRMVGRFSGIIVQLADGGKWDQPVTGSGKRVIKALIPAWEGQLKASEVDTNANSPTYGEPKFWAYTENAVQPKTDPGQAAPPTRSLTIHPDRIIILGDWRSGSSFLKAPYNAFVNLEKITGGSGESYLKNASRQIHINFDKETKPEELVRANGLKNTGELQQLIDDQAKDLNTGIDASLVTWGGTASPLVAVVPDPTPHYSVNIQTIAAATGLPAKVISGMQTGERASVEDLKQFNKQGQGRRINELSDDGEQLVAHLIRIGAVTPPAGETTFMWDDLTEASQGEKLANVVLMADVNQKSAGNGDLPVFASTELREAAGYENDAESEKAREEDLPDEEPADLPTIDPTTGQPVAPALPALTA